MTKDDYRELVRNIVEESTGIKAVELATAVVWAIEEKERKQNYDIWKDALDPLIEAGEIVELEYVLPTMDYRIKSIFFPKGTTFEMGHNVKFVVNAE